MVRRLRTLNTVVVAALATAGIAAAAAGDARPCHPDLPGTRSLAVTGEVTGYRFAGRGTLVASVQTKRCAGVARWNYAASTKATASVSCRGSSAGGSGAAPQRLVAAQGDRLVRVVLAPAGVDRPDRLDVVARATGRRISSWPLIDRPARVVLFGKIAIVSAASRNALYALRISDGRIAMLGVARAGDRPIIGREGVVYQDRPLPQSGSPHAEPHDAEARAARVGRAATDARGSPDPDALADQRDRHGREAPRVRGPRSDGPL